MERVRKSELKMIRETVARKLIELPTLKKRQENDLNNLKLLQDEGLPVRAQVVQRFMRSGVRLDEETVYKALVKNLKARIATQEHEITQVENALTCINSDKYYNIIFGRYILNKEDDVLAQELGCSECTIRKNRIRLLELMAVFIYGSTCLRRKEDIL